MKYLAHSADKNIEAQSYEDHVMGAYDRILLKLNEIKPYINPELYETLHFVVLNVILHHDVGKLYDEGQDVLRNPDNRKLPNHVDAGTSYLLKNDRFSAWISNSHHRGLGYYRYEDKDFRDNQPVRKRCPWIQFKGTMAEFTDLQLDKLMERHNEVIKTLPPEKIKISKIQAPLARLALSLIVEGDHYDTAKNYKNFVVDQSPPLRAEERLAKLDALVQQKQQESLADPKQTDKERVRIKQAIYEAARNSTVNTPFSFCASEVGTGKTTALMAYALMLAIKHNLRKIVYVAPFTSIISQTVETYRNLALPGENPNLVVAEHHHQVEYNHESLFEKVYAVLWNSPFIGTTAVQFFETLASSKTTRLRKFHELAGCVIIVDESHMNIPINLWPLALKFLDFLVKNMGCYVIFASGSMVKPWENEKIRKDAGFDQPVHAIIPDELARKTLQREKDRVKILYNSEKLTLGKMCDRVESLSGPKLVVCNTIMNAARLANAFKKRRGSHYVLHLSTCLVPEDRERILTTVKERLKKNPQEDWVLVATSCVEAGIDFSFMNGFRENSGLLSMLQMAGRISRNNEYPNATLHVFELEINYKDKIFTSNSEFVESSRIFTELYAVNMIGPEFANKAIDMELDRGGLNLIESHGKTISVQDLINMEDRLLLGKVKDEPLLGVSDYFQVVRGEKFTAIVDPTVLDVDHVDMTEVIRKSVQIYESKLDQCKAAGVIGKCERLPGFYIWTGQYDPDLLGYMADPNMLYKK